jgi:hypothetical protein
MALDEGVVLDCREDILSVGVKVRTVHVIEELAKDEALLGHRDK